MKKWLFCSLLFFALTCAVQAQTNNDGTLVQFSGMVLDGTNEQLMPVPYTNIVVQNSQRGTYSDYRGFFSIVVEKGDVIIFSALGYKTVEFKIPTDLEDNRYSIVQLMTQDAVNLPETVVFPWPSREHFKLEFLAMDVTSEMEDRALENLAEDALARMREEVMTDGNENADFYLRQQSRNYYYVGQTPPMRIFDVASWKRFFVAWKNGDFKKKDKQ